MIIKTIGAAVILFSSIALGFLMSMQESYRIKDLEEVKSILLKLFSSLRYDREVLATALERASRESNNPIGKIFNSIAAGIKNNNNPKAAWRIVFEKEYKNTFLKKEDCENLQRLANVIDNADMGLLQGAFNRVNENINEAISLAREKEQRDKRLYRSICTSIGVFLVIVLF